MSRNVYYVGSRHPRPLPLNARWRHTAPSHGCRASRTVDVMEMDADEDELEDDPSYSYY